MSQRVILYMGSLGLRVDIFPEKMISEKFPINGKNGKKLNYGYIPSLTDLKSF